MAEEKLGGRTARAGPLYTFDSATPDRVRVCAGSIPYLHAGISLRPGESLEFIRDDKVPGGWAPARG